MASEVDICNLALGHLGDNATVSSISPPEGSAQAEHCARFYPIARDALLELYAWGFSTRREQLPQLSAGWPEWAYCYAMPSDALNIIAVLPPDMTDDYSIGNNAVGNYVPQDFSCEVDAAGVSVIYSDQANAVVRYTSFVSDTTQFSPLFTMALSWQLASLLAGPIIKGDAGAAEGQRCAKMAQYYVSQAAESDASQRRISPTHNVTWMSGR